MKLIFWYWVRKKQARNIILYTQISMIYIHNQVQICLCYIIAVLVYRSLILSCLSCTVPYTMLGVVLICSEIPYTLLGVVVMSLVIPYKLFGWSWITSTASVSLCGTFAFLLLAIVLKKTLDTYNTITLKRQLKCYIKFNLPSQ